MLCFFVQSAMIAQDEIVVKKFSEESSLTKITDENKETTYYFYYDNNKLPLGKADVAYKDIDRFLKIYENNQPELSNIEVTEKDFSVKIGGVVYKITMFVVPIQGTQGLIISAYSHLDMYMYPENNPIFFMEKPKPGIRITQSSISTASSVGSTTFINKHTDYQGTKAIVSAPSDSWYIYIKTAHYGELKPFHKLALALEKEKNIYEKEQAKKQREQRKLEKEQNKKK